jgi:hypothetical protein
VAKTTVKIAKQNGKWKMTGTTYINNDENSPWPVTMVFSTKAEGLKWAQLHGWAVT